MKIKEARKLKKLTQKELADAIGVSFSVISKYENGTVIPPANRLEAISKVLEVSVDFLIGNGLMVEVMTSPNKSSENESTSSDMILDQNSILYKQLLTYTHGNCELCGNAAPFKKSGKPYLEMHQLISMSDGGLPIPENIVLLCPNCHTRIHQLKDTEDLDKLKKAAKKHRATAIGDISQAYFRQSG